MRRQSCFLLSPKKNVYLESEVRKFSSCTVQVLNLQSTCELRKRSSSPEEILLLVEYIRLLPSFREVTQGLCDPLAERGGCQVVCILRGGLQECQQLPAIRHPGSSPQAPDPGSPGQGILRAVTRKIQQGKLLSTVYLCQVSKGMVLSPPCLAEDHTFYRSTYLC